MSYPGAMAKMVSIVMGNVVLAPPLRYLEKGNIVNVPPGTKGKHLFVVEDPGGGTIGPLVGPVDGAYQETRSFVFVVNYPVTGKHSDFEQEIASDHTAIFKALINRANWAGDPHIVAVLLKKDCKVTRTGFMWQARMTFDAVING